MIAAANDPTMRTGALAWETGAVVMWAGFIPRGPAHEQVIVRAYSVGAEFETLFGFRRYRTDRAGA